MIYVEKSTSQQFLEGFKAVFYRGGYFSFLLAKEKTQCFSNKDV